MKRKSARESVTSGASKDDVTAKDNSETKVASTGRANGDHSHKQARRRSTRNSSIKQEETNGQTEHEDEINGQTEHEDEMNGNDRRDDEQIKQEDDDSKPTKKRKTASTPQKKVKVEETSPRKVKTEETTPKKTKSPARKSKRASATKKEESDSEGALDEIEAVKATKKAKSSDDLAAAKLKKLTSFVTSPYPNFAHPTPAECKKVVDLLSKLHGPAIRPSGRPIDDTSRGASCGAVPSVIDALVRTILSQNTTSKNSTAAKRSLDDTYGKGNWAAIDAASDADVEDAIRVGGLAPSKTKTIKNVLRTAFEKYGEFSLDHLHAVSNDDAMRELISFKGVGPKTASCVLLFCMARDSFAVDTHVFRLSKSLGWVPQKAGREETYGHLDVTIPGEYKYPLHTLLITHGKRCGRCSAHRKSGLLPANECPLIGISKTVKEEDLKMDSEGDDNDREDNENENENDEDEDEDKENAQMRGAAVDPQVKALVAKVEDAARQEQRHDDGMAAE